MKMHILFEVNTHENKSIKTFLGAFSTQEKAEIAAFDNDCKEGQYVIEDGFLDEIHTHKRTRSKGMNY